MFSPVSTSLGKNPQLYLQCNVPEYTAQLHYHSDTANQSSYISNQKQYVFTYRYFPDELFPITLGYYLCMVKSPTRPERHIILQHRGHNSKQINNAKYVSKFLIHGAKMLNKCVKSQKKILYIVFFCKVKLSKMASVKTNQIKKQTALF